MRRQDACDDTACRRAGKGYLGIALVAAVALVAALGVGATSAYAAGTTELPDSAGANWEVPTVAMTNTIWKDDEGNVVSEGTDGAKQYKVLTTWAEAWSTSGADYLGISNSAFFGNGGNGNPNITTYKMAARNTTVGVWATSANESPNAYNWNTFYNLYAATDIGDAYGAVASDWASMLTSGNGGADWSTEAGVWCGFKYRPDVVVTNNNLSADNAAIYIEQIRNGQYSATATSSGGTYYPDPDSEGGYDSSYYVYGDENYNPEIMGYANNSPYSFVTSIFKLATYGEAVIEDTADYAGLQDNELDWKTVNMLPRSNRYTETPTECAVNVEKLAKGSVYYTLSKIADGTVDKKKVAYVCYPWNYSSGGSGGGGGGGGRGPNSVDEGIQTLDTTESQVCVAVYDYTENIGTGPMDGRASWTPIMVDQLGASEGDDLEVYTAKTGGSSVNSDDGESTTTYTLYYATADDLLTCDVIYCSPNVTASQDEWQEWLIQNASNEDNATSRVNDMSYLLTWPCVTNGSNYTMEKLIYGTYGTEFIYPELFPSMQLSCYWCDNIYHLNDSILTTAMSWIYSTATMPAGTTLTDITAQYNSSVVENKFNQGLAYYQANYETDETISRILNNIGIDGSTEYAEGSPYSFNGFAPTEYWTTPYSAYNFEDVQDPSQYYYDAVYNIAALGLVTGYGPEYTIFGVGDSMTRKDFVTILWRFAEPDAYKNYDEASARNTSGLPDVANGQYYTAAVSWAVDNGVVTGNQLDDGSYVFAPDDPITFEQMITIVARYAIGQDAASGWDTSSLSDPKFTDAGNVADFARGPMAWAIDNGMVTGNDNGDGTYTLDPQENVPRERVVTVLWRAIDANVLI